MLGRPVSEIIAWQAAAIGYDHVNPMTVGLFRVHGRAACADGEHPWSMVLKLCRPPSEEDARRVPAVLVARTREAHRWDRELLAYESGLLSDLGGGLVAPHCYGVRREDQQAWLWLEDISANPAPWVVARYRLAARHLGQFNGSFLTDRALPSQDWLSRRWLQSWVGSLGAPQLGILEEATVWAHPLVRDAFPVAACAELQVMLSERAALHRLLDELPQTFCHLDAFRANLMARVTDDGHDTTVAIDWAYAGIGPVGCDASNLATASAFFYGEQLAIAELDAATWEGYLAGLDDVGWLGDRRLARAGYLAANVTRWMFVGLPSLRAVSDEAMRARIERSRPTGFAGLVRSLGARTAYLLQQARELRALAPLAGSSS